MKILVLLIPLLLFTTTTVAGGVQFDAIPNEKMETIDDYTKQINGLTDQISHLESVLRELIEFRNANPNHHQIEIIERNIYIIQQRILPERRELLETALSNRDKLIYELLDIPESSYYSDAIKERVIDNSEFRTRRSLR